MTGSKAGFASAALGVALLAYAAVGLMNVRVPHIPASAEWWLGPFVGGATGLMTAATGVFVIPAVPYLQALSFDREELMKALGLSFTVSTVALAWSLAGSGTLDPGSGLYSLLALFPALAGMIAGQRLLGVMRPETFRRWFFLGLMLLYFLTVDYHVFPAGRVVRPKPVRWLRASSGSRSLSVMGRMTSIAAPKTKRTG